MTSSEFEEMGKEILKKERTMRKFLMLTDYHKKHTCHKCPHTLFDHVYTCENVSDPNCPRIPVCVYCGCKRTIY